jgi:hypothetical protein
MRRKFGDDGLPMIAVADSIATMAVTQIAICLVSQYLIIRSFSHLVWRLLTVSSIVY